MSAYQRILFKYKAPVLLIFLGITIYLASHLVGISVESKTHMWFKEDDPHYIKYRNFKAEFGNDHLLVLGISSRDPISDEMETCIKKISEKIRQVEGVQSVWHIFDFDSPLFKSERVQRVLRDFFLSEDLRAAQIIVNVTEAGSQILRVQIVENVRNIARWEKPSGCEVHLSGSLYMGIELDRYARENAKRVILFTLGAIALMLLLIFRDFSFTAAVLLTSLIAVIWAMGFYVLMGNAVNLVTNMIAPLVLVVSIAVGIHIINRVQEERQKAISWKDAVISGVSHIWKPCLLTSLTTSLGFFSLYFSPSKAISQFGLYASLAMLFEFFVFFHIFPLVLHSFHKTRPSEKEKKGKGRSLEGLLDRNVHILTSHKNKVIPVFLVSTIVLAAGVLRIDINTNQLKYFSSKNELVKSAGFFDKFFGGVYPIQAVLTTGPKSTLQDPDTLRKILDFQSRAVEECGLTREISLADILTSQNDILAGGNPSNPDNAPGDFQSFLFRGAGTMLRNIWADRDLTKTVVTFRAPSDISSKEMMDIQVKLENIAAKIFYGDNVSIEFTGIIPLYAHFHENIIKTQIISFSIAFILINIVIGIAFRSFPLMLAVAFSNLISIVMIFGLMGYLGINLDAGTVMIASCALGIIVDDTIHILHRTGVELKKSGHVYPKAIGRTIKTLGKALITTSVTIGLGFLVLVMNDFKPVQFFGILMALTMFSALLADMILLPSLVERFKLKFKP